MSFNKVALKHKNARGWTSLFGNQRSMSNSRLLATVFSWLLGLSAIYCSLFYVPAFIDFKKSFGMSSASPKFETAKKSFLKPYNDLLIQNKAFLRNGQTMEAHYKLGSNSGGGQLLFYKCQSPLVVQIFSCNPVIIKTLPLRKTKGSFALKVNLNGFYGLRASLANPETEYDIVWRRRFK